MLSLGSSASHSRAIQFVSVDTATTSTVTLSPRLEEHDLMIGMTLNDNTVPAGWTSGGTGTSGALTYSWSWKYFATGDTEYATDGDITAVIAFRNVDPMYPFDATATSATGATGLPDAPSITTVNPSSVVVALGWLDDDNVTLTAPSGYRSIFSLGETSSGSMSAVFREVATAGAENPAAFGGSGNDEHAAVTIALRSSAYARQMVAYSSTGTLIHTFGGYKYHVFTSGTPTFHIASVGTVDKIEVLCVAGGGGGGEGSTGGGGGGGGAGGVEMLAITPTATNYAVVVGSGGAGATTNTSKGVNGGASSFGGTLVAVDGGGGGGSTGVGGVANGSDGGSGGGGASAGTLLGGNRTVVGEGSNGGDGGTGNGGGGGGGSQGNGGNATTTDTGGTGGTGTIAYETWFTHITNAGGATYGENGRIASGGGGGGDVTAGTSPDGGGGNGATGVTNATAGLANTGGGGGGSETGNGGAGGSGIVIVRYRHVALG